MIHKIEINEFIELSKSFTVLDVRSPGEYAHAHIPGAYSLPLFTDDERKVVGTAYKQQSKQDAVKIGLDYFGVKMRKMVEEVEALQAELKKSEERTVIVHCWRGGMRSGGVAWLLDLYGFKVYQLIGGYKAYRNWALAQFSKEYPINVLGGYTGSGKTEVLHELKKSGAHILDIEAIACHKGSAFGGFGMVQPSQEMFENTLALQLAGIDATEENRIWVEDESRRIGDVNLPAIFFNTMQLAPLYFVDIPFNERLTHIVSAYSKHKKEELVNAIIRIQKRLGGQDTKSAINALLENDYKSSFSILLRYYDKHYGKSLVAREKSGIPLHQISLATVDAVANSRHLIH